MQNYALNRERKAVKENKAIDKQEKADAKVRITTQAHNFLHTDIVQLAAEAEAPTHDWMKPDFAGERVSVDQSKMLLYFMLTFLDCTTNRES